MKKVPRKTPPNIVLPTHQHHLNNVSKTTTMITFSSNFEACEYGECNF